MENKKLVKILLKDMAELEEMIAETKAKGDFDALEMEIIHTRAKSILQLLQLLKGMEQPVEVPKMPPQKVEVAIEDEPVKKDEYKPETKEIPQPVEKREMRMQEEEPKGEVKAAVEEKEEVPGKQEQVVVEVEQEEIEVEENYIAESESNDVELEEEELEEANQRLGDSFLKGKSVNDILTGQNKLEFKLSNRPVVNIQSAIGINDRFQYIRELFDGSAETFAQTVTDLDGMNNINEAVKYLQKNFKWKKNETSLKFVNLIKRRFPND